MEVDIILLGILSGGDFFGYEIMKIIKSVMSDIASVTTGTLYYKLKKHEKAGYLRSSSEREGLRPQRTRYAITAAGREVFQRLAMENISSRKRPYWPYLASIFFVQHLPADKTSAALRKKRANLLKTRERILATQKLMGTRDYPFHALMIAEHGLRHLDVDIAWIEEFALRLDEVSAGRNIPAFSPEDWRSHLDTVTGEDRS